MNVLSHSVDAVKVDEKLLLPGMVFDLAASIFDVLDRDVGSGEGRKSDNTAFSRGRIVGKQAEATPTANSIAVQFNNRAKYQVRSAESPVKKILKR